MRTLGLLGGMTYRSTALYYNQINAHVQARLGGGSSAPLILHSFDFASMAALFGAGRWDEVAVRFAAAARPMAAAGATGLAIGCNIGHRVSRELGAAVPEMQLLHVAEFAGRAVAARGLRRVGLLATRAAMDGDFISAPLATAANGAEVLVPEREEDRAAIDSAVFTELAEGRVTEETTTMMLRVVDELVARGAEGIVLACTDLQFVLTPENVKIPLFDTLELHAKGLADWILETES